MYKPSATSTQVQAALAQPYAPGLVAVKLLDLVDHQARGVGLGLGGLDVG